MEVLIGFLIAVVIAVTGVGAGTLTAPMLILFLHVPVPVAVGTALTYSAIVKLIVVPVQIWRKNVNYRIAGWMLAGGLPGVVLGSLIFRGLAAHGNKSVLYALLGSIISASSVWHIYRYFRPPALERPVTNRPKWIAALMLPIGVEVGFSSSGAGAFGTVALLSLTSLTTAQVVGTDLTFGLAMSVVGSGIHMLGGGYDAMLLLKLAIGGVFGALFGVSLAGRLPNRQLRFALWSWLLVIGMQLCYQAAHAAIR